MNDLITKDLKKISKGFEKDLTISSQLIPWVVRRLY